MTLRMARPDSICGDHMGALDGNVGGTKISKKTAAIGGVAVVGILGIAWYRSKTESSANTNANVDATGDTSEIDPSTGYPYGTTDDASALTAQDDYLAAGD